MSAEPEIRLSIVIIEYLNTEEALSAAVAFRANTTALATEIIVVSNSAWPSAVRARLVEDYSWVDWVFLDRNSGFAEAMNRGIAAARGEYVMVSNPDVQIHRGDLVTVLAWMDNAVSIGMVCPRFIDKAGKTLDYCRKFVTPVSLMKRCYKRITRRNNVIIDDEFDYSAAHTVDWGIGALLVVRRSLLSSVGSFDERYFMYVEDMDWCRRAWEAGFSIVYLPQLVCRYNGSLRSSGFLGGNGRINRYTFYHVMSLLKYFLKFGCADSARIGRHGELIETPWRSGVL